MKSILITGQSPSEVPSFFFSAAVRQCTGGCWQRPQFSVSWAGAQITSFVWGGSVTLTCRKGTMPSREMAWSRRGAPVRLCSPAPQVEKKDPMTMTQGDGQARVPTTRLPFTASPNLGRDSKGSEIMGEQCHPDSRVGLPRPMVCPVGC